MSILKSRHAAKIISVLLIAGIFSVMSAWTAGADYAKSVQYPSETCAETMAPRFIEDNKDREM